MAALIAKSNPNQNGRADHHATPFGLNPDRIRDVADDHMTGQCPPHDLETERCLLGAALCDGEAIDRTRDIVGVEAFYSARHRLIWSAMLAMRDRSEGIDDLTLRVELERRDQLKDVGGRATLDDLMETVRHAVHATDYARIIRAKFDLRRAGEIGRELVRKSLIPGADPVEIMADTETDVRALGESRASRRTFAGVDAAELQTYATQEPDWLVQDLFTADELLLVGARSKGCKTLQLVDLTVAFASGTPWMRAFEVRTRRRVLFVSGETNNRRMSRHLERACRVRGLSFSDLAGMVRVEAVNFPNLPSPDDLRSIERTVKRHGIEVVILDPLYRGMAGVDAAQLNEMGSAIRNFQAACFPACLILSHHVVKSAAREYGTPPSLDDMTGAGVAESCGQWWLVGRNEKYGWDGMHDLCVSYGGREGQAGGKRIVFDERAWTFEVENLIDYIASEDEERQRQLDARKSEAETRKRNQARVKIVAACRNIKTPQSRTRIRDTSGQSGATFGAVFSELVTEETLLVRPYRDARNRIVTEGHILAEYAPQYDQIWEANGDAG